MTVILCEKPILAKNVTAALPGQMTMENGIRRKGEYVIIESWGHLLTLKMPEDYDPAFKEWRLDALPIYFPNWQKKVNDRPRPGQLKTGNGNGGQKERLTLIAQYLKKADMVIHLADPDDEGQLLLDEIIEYCGYKGPVRHLDATDNTPSGLAAAMRHMDDNTAHVRVGRAAYARSVADLILGINPSRYFTLNNPGVLIAVGRVQTPTLGLVVRRDALIENHTVIYYYTIAGTLRVNGVDVPVRYVPDPNDANLVDGRILHKDYAQKLLGQLLKEKSFDATVEKKKESEQPPLPFNKTKLSVYAEKNWGYDPMQTMQITQNLRDGYNAISYNRTDCQYLLENQHDEAPKVMDCVTHNINFCPKTLDLSIKSRAFNDKIVRSGEEAHTAIIPQAVRVDVSKLPEPEHRVYLAVCKYYMAQFMPPAQKLKTTLDAKCSFGGSLRGTSTVITDPGWRAIFKEAEPEDESPLSSLAAGSYPQSELTTTEIGEGHTSPPPRYTMATLEDDMTMVAKYVNDPKIKEILKKKDEGKPDENGSIGTVATRPAIIKSLLDHQYLEPLGGKGNKICSTALGREMCRILPRELVEPELTAAWWCIQEDIKSGTATEQTLIDSVLATVNTILHTDYPKINMSVVPDRYKRGVAGGKAEPLGVCPNCGKPVIEGKLGFGCSGYKEGCKFVIWKQSKRPMLQGISFTASDAKKFLEGKSVQKSGLKKTDGGTFSAPLKMTYDKENERVDISPDFSDESKETIGKCPNCGRPVTETSMGFGCTGYKEGCKFTIWKKSKRPMFSGITFTASDAKKFLKGEPVLKRKLKKKAGGTFDAYLRMTYSPGDPFPSIEPDFSMKPPQKGSKP